MLAAQAFEYFRGLLKKEEAPFLLDVGCGKSQVHAKAFKEAGVQTFTCDFFENADFKGAFRDITFPFNYHAIWCSHCLEHQTDVGAFLRKAHSILTDDGLFCVTVPPAKHEIVGGHLTIWNLGLLYYNLILAGFDCSEAVHKTYGYNISVVVRKRSFELPKLNYDTGDIELLAPYFPFPVEQGFDGNAIPDTF